jgi:hypothetical protein
MTTEASAPRRKLSAIVMVDVSEPGDKRRPTGEECGERTVGLAQIDVFTARAWPQRRELRIRHRTHERQQAADDPSREKQPGVRKQCGDLGRGEENTAADDVGHDDRGRLEPAEAVIEIDRVGSELASGCLMLYTGVAVSRNVVLKRIFAAYLTVTNSAQSMA